MWCQARWQNPKTSSCKKKMKEKNFQWRENMPASCKMWWPLQWPQWWPYSNKKQFATSFHQLNDAQCFLEHKTWFSYYNLKLDENKNLKNLKPSKWTKTLNFWKTTVNVRPSKFMKSTIVQFWGWIWIQNKGRSQGIF